MNNGMELDIINSGETTEVVEHLGKSKGGSFGKTLLGILGISAVGYGIARIVREHKRKKKLASYAWSYNKEELIQKLIDEGYTILEPLEDIVEPENSDVETE